MRLTALRLNSDRTHSHIHSLSDTYIYTVKCTHRQTHTRTLTLSLSLSLPLSRSLSLSHIHSVSLTQRSRGIEKKQQHLTRARDCQQGDMSQSHVRCMFVLFSFTFPPIFASGRGETHRRGLHPRTRWPAAPGTCRSAHQEPLANRQRP